MGRHAAPPEPDPQGAALRSSRDGARPAGRRWSERLLVALVVGVLAGGVAVWAAAGGLTAAAVALGAAAVTLVASWVASTVPGPPA